MGVIKNSSSISNLKSEISNPAQRGIWNLRSSAAWNLKSQISNLKSSAAWNLRSSAAWRVPPRLFSH